jgi:hypothetical protein
MARASRDLMARTSRARDSSEPPLIKRVGWMALIWAMSVSLLGVVSLLLRWWLK